VSYPSLYDEEEALGWENVKKVLSVCDGASGANDVIVWLCYINSHPVTA
jgi:hypothetical protein